MCVFCEMLRVCFVPVKVLKSVKQWFDDVVNTCNKKVGTPHQRCIRVLEGAVTDCRAKLGPMFSWLCSVTYVGTIVCKIIRPLDFICVLLDFVSGDVAVIVKRSK